MTKKKVLVASFFGASFFVIAMYVSIMGVCSFNFICDRAHDDSMAAVLFPFIPLFIFSLITFKMREEIFQYWWKFARFLIPASMLAILISPSYTHNWMFPIEKGTVALASSAFFLIASLFIIAHKSLQLRKK